MLALKALEQQEPSARPMIIRDFAARQYRQMLGQPTAGYGSWPVSYTGLRSCSAVIRLLRRRTSCTKR